MCMTHNFSMKWLNLYGVQDSALALYWGSQVVCLESVVANHEDWISSESLGEESQPRGKPEESGIGVMNAWGWSGRWRLQQFPAPTALQLGSLIVISAGRLWAVPRGVQLHRTSDHENFGNCAALTSTSLFFFCVSSLLPHPKSWVPACSPPFLLYLRHSQKFVSFYGTADAQMFRICYLQLLESSGAAPGGSHGFHLGFGDRLRIGASNQSILQP